MRYEVSDSNEVYVYVETQDDPILYQPDYPDGSPWTKEEAKAWAETFVAHFLDDSQPEAPSSPPADQE